MNLEKQLAFTGKEEGLRLTVYKCPSGKDTIGYGHNISDNNFPDSMPELKKRFTETLLTDFEITNEEASQLFEVDALEAERLLKTIFPDWSFFTENRQIALIDMMFNMGYGKFNLFKSMIMAIKSGMWHLAAQEAKESLWYQQVTNRANRIIKLLQDG